MKLTDVIGCAGSSILLLLASAWVPFVGPFFSLLAPLPFLYWATKLGRFQGVQIAAITLLLIGVISRVVGFPELFFFGLEFILLGLAISELYKRNFTFGLTVFWGTIIMLFVGSFFLFLTALSKNMGPLEMVLGYFQDNLKETIRAYENLGLDQETILHLQEYSKVLTGIIAAVYPALLIVGAGFVVWMNVIVSKPLFRMGSFKYPDFGQIDRWQSPEHLVWGVIVSGFALFLTEGGIKFVAMNALIVIAAIYVFHGLSIILFFFNKYHVSPWIRFGGYLLIVFQQVFLVGLAVAGLFDQWVDFRRLKIKRAG